MEIGTIILSAIFLVVAATMATIGAFCYIIASAIYRVALGPDYEEGRLLKFFLISNEKTDRGVAWLKKWWPLMLYGFIFAWICVEWELILKYWFIFLPVHIASNLFLGSRADLKSAWTNRDYGWLNSQILFQWPLRLLGRIPTQESERTP